MAEDLIRNRFSAVELPARLWLLASHRNSRNYSIAVVEAGGFHEIMDEVTQVLTVSG